MAKVSQSRSVGRGERLAGPASVIAALAAVALVELGAVSQIATDELLPGALLRCSWMALTLASFGAALGLAGLLASRRRRSLFLLAAVAGLASNATFLWFFGPPILCLSW